MGRGTSAPHPVLSLRPCICVIIVTSLLMSAQYSNEQSSNIITGEEMKLDLGTESFTQNKFTFFRLIIFHVLMLKFTV